MNMVEKEKDLIGFAHKVISFRMNVIKACKAKGIDAPTDEQISDYINDYGLHFEDFMADFTEHEGMFRCLRTPLEEFVGEVNEIEWCENKPSYAEIEEFFNKNGNDVKLFCQQHITKGMKPLERKVYLKTISELNIELLVALWNLFIEESGLYGEDSCIYDLNDDENITFLHEHMNGEELQRMYNLKNNGVRYIQWFGLNDNAIQAKSEDDIKHMIIAFWGEIFERIMVFPTCYEKIVDADFNVFYYFDNIVWPIITKNIGIEICQNNGTMKYCKESTKSLV